MNAAPKTFRETASLAQHGELIVAESNDAVVGAVAYIGPNRPKAEAPQIFGVPYAIYIKRFGNPK